MSDQAILSWLRSKGLRAWEIMERFDHARTGYLFRTVQCPQCGCHPVGFVVHDHVWAGTGLPLGNRQAGWWCLDCFERRLGRRVTREDLKDVPLSDWLYVRLE